MHTEHVYCLRCNKELSYWGPDFNFQKEEEWECLGKYRRRVQNVFRDSRGTRISSFVMDGGAGTVVPLPKGMKRIKTELWFCSLTFHTKFCAICAKKLKYRCSRKGCKGELKKVREFDGKPTEWTHSGW